MKKLPMILLLIVPYATLIICYQANLDITVGLCVYGALLLFNMVYAFLLPRLGFGVMGVFLAEPISNVIGGLACYLTMRMTIYKKLEREEKAACSV